jgi:YggT family protein
MQAPDEPMIRPVVSGEQTEAIVTDPYANRRYTMHRACQAIYLIFGIVEALIVIRFVLRLLGANAEASFASLVYRISAPLVAPFAGLFGTPQVNGNALDLEAIVAIVVYGLVAWGFVKLAWLLLGETRSGVRTHSRSVDTDSA